MLLMPRTMRESWRGGGQGPQGSLKPIYMLTHSISLSVCLDAVMHAVGITEVAAGNRVIKSRGWRRLLQNCFSKNRIKEATRRETAVALRAGPERATATRLHRLTTSPFAASYKARKSHRLGTRDCGSVRRQLCGAGPYACRGLRGPTHPTSPRITPQPRASRPSEPAGCGGGRVHRGV